MQLFICSPAQPYYRNHVKSHFTSHREEQEQERIRALIARAREDSKWVLNKVRVLLNCPVSLVTFMAGCGAVDSVNTPCTKHLDQKERGSVAPGLLRFWYTALRAYTHIQLTRGAYYAIILLSMMQIICMHIHVLMAPAQRLASQCLSPLALDRKGCLRCRHRCSSHVMQFVYRQTARCNRTIACVALMHALAPKVLFVLLSLWLVLRVFCSALQYKANSAAR